MTKRRLLFAALCLAASATAVRAAQVTRIVVSFSPGGPVDAVARALGEQLGQGARTHRHHRQQAWRQRRHRRGRCDAREARRQHSVDHQRGRGSDQPVAVREAALRHAARLRAGVASWSTTSNCWW